MPSKQPLHKVIRKLKRLGLHVEKKKRTSSGYLEVWGVVDGQEKMYPLPTKGGREVKPSHLTAIRHKFNISRREWDSAK